MRKKLLATLLIASFASFNVYAVNGNSSVRAWNAASSSDKAEYARSVARVINETAGRTVVQAQTVLSCMEEVMRPPVEAYMEFMTVGEIAAGCVQILVKR